MAATAKALREEYGTLHKQMTALTAPEREADFNAEDQATWDKCESRIAEIESELDQIAKSETRKTRVADMAGKLKEHTRHVAPGSGKAIGKPEPDAPITFEFPRGYESGNHELALSGEQEDMRPLVACAKPEYQTALHEYMRTGRASAALQVGKDTKGGYLTTMRFMAELIQSITDRVNMRQICRVLPPLTDAVSLGVPSLDTRETDATWTAEIPASDLTEADNIVFGKRELMPHLMTKYVTIGRKLLRQAVIDPESIVRAEMARLMGETEENAFLTGDGAQKPLGVFTASNDGITTSQDVTGASATTFGYDDLVNTLYALKAKYQDRATWFLHRDAVKIARKIKDSLGQPIWSFSTQAPLAQGQLGTILGRPYVMSEFAPSTFTTGLYALMIGDFSHYWIVDALTMEVEVFTGNLPLTNRLGFIGRKETDGMPVLAEAFRRLKLA